MPNNEQTQKVYVIQHQLGPIKIGRAKDPRQRLKDLQVACPFQLKLRKTQTPDNALEVEKFLHRKFQKYHLQGEWFDVPPGQRDLDIPTKVNKLGIPNKPVEISNNRDTDNEWAEIFERVHRAFRDTKSRTSNYRQLRNQWQEMKSDDPEKQDSERYQSELSLHDIKEDTPSGQKRCSQCGFHYEPQRTRMSFVWWRSLH
ncbi:GIY-YIG nuclease family protein [Natrialbaceae archaeon GCM10025896]